MAEGSTASKVRRALRNPGDAWSALQGRFRGLVFKSWCAVFHPRVQIGRGLVLFGKLKIRGPGAVIIGNNVTIMGRVTPYTFAAEATIRIGDKSVLDGTRFSSKHGVDIGAQCLLSECRIIDTDFHCVNPDYRNDLRYIMGAPIEIGANSWITMGCIIQKGTVIGEGCTITPNSVVGNTTIPPYSLAGNSSAMTIRAIRRLS